MPIIRSREVTNFTIIPNETLRDRGISRKARGLLVEMLSLPPDTRISIDWLVENNDCDGETGVRSGLKELEAAGYLVRRRTRQDDGRFVWESYVYSRRQSPEVEPSDAPADLPSVENRRVDNARSNKDGCRYTKNDVVKETRPTTGDSTPRTRARTREDDEGGLVSFSKEGEVAAILARADADPERRNWRPILEALTRERLPHHPAAWQLSILKRWLAGEKPPAIVAPTITTDPADALPAHLATRYGVPQTPTQRRDAAMRNRYAAEHRARIARATTTRNPYDEPPLAIA